MPSEYNHSPATAGYSSPGFDTGENGLKTDPDAEFFAAEASRMVPPLPLPALGSCGQVMDDLAGLEEIDPELATLIRLEREANADDDDD